MNEISITRFVPTSPVREKISSVDTTQNDPENPSSFLPQQNDSMHEHGKEDKSKDTSVSYQTQEDNQEETPLETAVAKLNEFVQTVQRDIIFGIDSGTDEPLVTVVDRASRKILRQFGGKEALELAKKVDTQEPFSLLKTQV